MFYSCITQIQVKMPKIVLIEKAGTLKTLNVKDFTEETLYKKAGMKSGEGFVLQHTWGAEDGLDQSIKLYAKKTGRAGQENKYDFPPPVDETLFFGPCVLVGSDLSTGKILDLGDSDWEEIYEYLFGGFEELGEDDSDDEDDIDTEDEIDAIKTSTGDIIKQTKQGYVQDGFIVDDDDEEDDYMDSDDDTPPPRKTSAKGKKSSKQTSEKSSKIIVQPDENMLIEDCESELSEEPYL